MEFPSFISQLLQPIGPLRISDELEYVLMYAPSPNIMQNYGRGAVQALIEKNYSRIMDNLRLQPPEF